MNARWVDRLTWAIYGATAMAAVVLWMLAEAKAETLITVRARVLIAEPLQEHLGLIGEAQELVTARAASAGVRLRTTRFDVVPDAGEKWNTITGFWQQRTRFNWEQAQHRSRRRSITIVYAPPLDGRYFGGYGWVCSLNGGLSVNHINPLADYALTKSALVVAHEAGHMLGAHADNSLPPTIMHDDAGHHKWAEGLPEYSDKSKSEIQRCVRKYLRVLRRSRRARRGR